MQIDEDQLAAALLFVLLLGTVIGYALATMMLAVTA